MKMIEILIKEQLGINVEVLKVTPDLYSEHKGLLVMCTNSTFIIDNEGTVHKL